jgi:hypothetical protein
MSELILLPGNGKYNEEWIEKVESHLNDLFSSTHIQRYRHWDKNRGNIDLEYELSVLNRHVGLPGDLFVFAKSMGSVLTMEAINREIFRPKGAVFCGLPVLWAREHGISIDEIAQDYSLPTTFVQNSDDPYCDVERLFKFFKVRNMKNHCILETSGDSHDYEDFGVLKKAVRERLDLTNY